MGPRARTAKDLLSRIRWAIPRILASAVLVAGFVTWYVYYVADPRLKEETVIPELLAPISGDGATDDVRASMARLAEIFLSREDNVGIVLGVTIGDRRHIVARGTAGRRGKAHPLDGNTVFEIGSITKGLTGIALAQATLSGVLTLDQPVSGFDPDSGPLPDITLEELATHTGGIPSTPPSIRPWRFLFPPNPFRRFDETELWTSLSLASAEVPAERSYRYSNFGFMLLSRILEKATHSSYAELVEVGIAAPLGMVSTRVVLTDSLWLRFADGHALGHRMEHNVDYELPGAEGVVSSMNDMLTLAEALIEPQRTPLADALRLATAERRRAREGVMVGLGWHVRSGQGESRVIYHRGETLGFYSSLAVAPTERIGVVVLANSRDPSVGVIGDSLMAMLLP